MSDQGWVKLHRKFNKWEWKDSPKHVAVFLDLLVNANHKDKKYRGKIVKKGQLTTSYQALSDRTGVSMQSIRTVLKDLKSTQEITHQNMRNYSIITITKWDEYQPANTEANIELTSNQHSTNIQLTTNKNVKNIKNVKNSDFDSPVKSEKFDLEYIYQHYPKKQGKKKGIEKLSKIIKTQDTFDLILQGAKKYSEYCAENNTESRYIKQFSTWVNGEHWNDEFETNKSLENEIIKRLEAL